jgi:hypothetical protein
MEQYTPEELAPGGLKEKEEQLVEFLKTQWAELNVSSGRQT